MKPLRYIVLLAALMLAACSQEPREVHYGSDECAHCKMMITDSRFASQIVTETGKAIKFDAIECLSAYHQNNSDEFENEKLWVSNFAKPGEWLLAKDAQFLKSDVVKSPMGESLLALPSKEKAESHIEEYPGTMMSWKEVTGTQDDK